jgi:hypothetical protein
VLILARPQAGEECLIPIGPAREAIVSWNARELEGGLEVRVNAHDGRTSAWLPYVAFSAEGRTSLDGRDTFVRFETDVLRSDVDMTSLGIRSARAARCALCESSRLRRAVRDRRAPGARTRRAAAFAIR